MLKMLLVGLFIVKGEKEYEKEMCSDDADSYADLVTGWLWRLWKR